MNALKREIIDIVNQMPDDVQDTDEALDYISMMKMIDERTAEYEKNGGIPHEEVVLIMEKYMAEYKANHA